MNLAIWINGNKKLKSELSRQLGIFETEIGRLQREAAGFHKKKVGGKEYWYHSGGGSGVWRYVCPAQRNPTRIIKREIERIHNGEEKVRQRLETAVIKVLGTHLVVDLDRFKPSDGEIISLLELYEALKELKK